MVPLLGLQKGRRWGAERLGFLDVFWGVLGCFNNIFCCFFFFCFLGIWVVFISFFVVFCWVFVCFCLVFYLVLWGWGLGGWLGGKAQRISCFCFVLLR